MKVLGVNKGNTLKGKGLRHGGAALYVDGKLVAVAEERVTGKKYAGGYDMAVDALLKANNVDLCELDAIAVSTCCEPEDFALRGHPFALDEVAAAKIVTVNHHLSHAALAFYGSGFDEALVAVIDGGGNVLEDEPIDTDARWWTLRREQHSYYLANKRGGLELIDLDFDEAYSTGLGEIYRAFTYYLGWHSSTNSSKTMALAGHGRRDAISNDKLVEFLDGRLLSPIVNSPADPIEMVGNLSQELGVDFGEPRLPGGTILQIHKDVAAFLQRSVEVALYQKLKYLKKKHKVAKICLSGGFALNVVVNGKLLSLFDEGIYVPSAPGDDGQCLGNVFAAVSQIRNEGVKIGPMKKGSDAFLGQSEKINSKGLADALSEAGLKHYIVFETSDFSVLISRILSSGSVVCLFQERSEFGPRALGSRSILADPRRADAVSRLNSLKSREWFMPFAPAVLAEHVSEWFEQNPTSPFMSFAVAAKPRTLEKLPAVANHDGTSRIQTIGKSDESALRGILVSFAARTGVPVLLNTSFNLGEKPIVESLKQAIDSFYRMPVNVLGVGRFVVLKSLSPDLEDLPFSSSLKAMSLEVYQGGVVTPIDLPASHPWKIIRRLQSLTDSVIFVRTELPLFGRYLEWLREGRKVTTIRFRKGAVEVPFSSRLPLFETPDFSPGDRSKPTEHVAISSLRYQRFGELTVADALRDGFRDLADMRQGLKTIYPELSDEDWVTVYDISIVGPGNQG